MLKVNNLQARIGDTNILNGLTLEVKPGEVHAIMGPNGSGKSTLARVLSGHPDYEVTGGEIDFEGEDLLEMEAEERANKGVFMSFQHPVEIPGVQNTYFLKAALNARRKSAGEDELDAYEFLSKLKEKMELLEMDASFKKREVNVGFSGGEKKRNEVLQLTMLEPKLAVLDELDSGLDIDALRIVAKGVNSLRDAGRSFILVTHYQRLLDYIEPDHVHVLKGGKIVKSGGKELAKELEDTGYEELS
jgi:Fe-S cluster assembly ATP-binding protein